MEGQRRRRQSVGEDKSGTQFVEIYVPKNIKSLDSALNELDKELSSVLKNIKVSEPINASQNGINVTAVAGTGVERKEGVPMTFTVGIYERKASC
jgi:hypothetical protein